jgi:hypothetical protein
MTTDNEHCANLSPISEQSVSNNQQDRSYLFPNLVKPVDTLRGSDNIDSAKCGGSICEECEHRQDLKKKHYIWCSYNQSCTKGEVEK